MKKQWLGVKKPPLVVTAELATGGADGDSLLKGPAGLGTTTIWAKQELPGTPDMMTPSPCEGLEEEVQGEEGIC